MKNPIKKPLSELKLPPEKQDKLLERIDFVQKLLDPAFSEQEKRALKDQFMDQTGCSERTIRNYLHRYKEQGEPGLVLHADRKGRGSKVTDALIQKIKELLSESPGRTITKVRELMMLDSSFSDQASKVSERMFYRIALSIGLSHHERKRLRENARLSYRSFEAPCSMALIQGDARDGIWINVGNKNNRKTYLFLWIDDFSRKILYGEYYWDEKLPRMEDSFRKMVLRYGLPEKVYLDNGSVYIAHQFRFVLHDLDVNKIHHPAYSAYCKGKVEAAMKKIKNDFQSEAQKAGFLTLRELNTAFHAWVNVKYDKQILTTTGEAPGERFIKGLTAPVRRITDIDHFNQMFLWRDSRTVNKYGRIKVKGNIYPVKNIGYNNVVKIRYDPFDLSKIYLYSNDDKLLEIVEPVSLNYSQVNLIPEESKEPENKVSKAAREYFASLRALDIAEKKKILPNLDYTKINKQEESNE